MVQECNKCGCELVCNKCSEIVEQTLTPYQRALLKHKRDGVLMQKDISSLLSKEGFTSTPQKVSQNIKWMRKKGIVILRHARTTTFSK